MVFYKDRDEMHSISEQLDKGVSTSILIIILYWICNCAADNKEWCLIHICICWEDCIIIFVFTKYLFFIHPFLWKQRVHKWICGLWLIGQGPESWGKSLTLEITVLGKLVSFISAFMDCILLNINDYSRHSQTHEDLLCINILWDSLQDILFDTYYGLCLKWEENNVFGLHHAHRSRWTYSRSTIFWDWKRQENDNES